MALDDLLRALQDDATAERLAAEGRATEAAAAVLEQATQEAAALEASLRDSPSYPAVFRALLRESRAASPTARRLRVDRRDARLAAVEAEDLEVVATLDSWGGVELDTNDGRTIRNTLEERLSNAESLLRARFARWLTARTEALSGGPR